MHLSMRSTEGYGRNAKSTPGGFVLVSLYSWMIITLSVVIARFLRGLIIHKVKFGRDDAVALAACVIYIGTVVGWQFTVDAGLGKSSSVDSIDEALFSRAMLVTQLLEIITMSLAKLSSGLLIERVVSQSRKTMTSLFVMVGAWTAFSCFAIAFRCGIPTERVALQHQCSSSGLLIVVIVGSMITDLVLAFWIMPTLITISLEKEKRIAAMVLFGSRAIVPVIAGAQIWAVVGAVSGEDPTRDVVEFAVLSQAVTSLSIITANIPRIKQFLGVGGSGILYPRIQASELSAVGRNASRRASGEVDLRLVPSNSGKFTVTITSKGSEDKRKSRVPPDWHGLVALGSREDDQTSTSSLFGQSDREGVLLKRDFQVVVERKPDDPRP